MKERPILFSGPMIRAILSGQKTQTRRLVKPQPEISVADPPGTLFYKAKDSYVRLHAGVDACPFSPYGVPGDRLWVRETWRPVSPEWAAPDGGPVIVRYAADGAEHMHGEARIGDWRWPVAARRGDVPGIHMPRWASRIDLEIVGVRVERLQDISEGDALAEGITAEGVMDGGYHVNAFANLWDHINGARATWASNPWVWVVEFKRVQP